MLLGIECGGITDADQEEALGKNVAVLVRLLTTISIDYKYILTLVGSGVPALCVGARATRQWHFRWMGFGSQRQV